MDDRKCPRGGALTPQAATVVISDFRVYKPDEIPAESVEGTTEPLKDAWCPWGMPSVAK